MNDASNESNDATDAAARDAAAVRVDDAPPDASGDAAGTRDGDAAPAGGSAKPAAEDDLEIDLGEAVDQDAMADEWAAALAEQAASAAKRESAAAPARPGRSAAAGAKGAVASARRPERRAPEDKAFGPEPDAEPMTPESFDDAQPVRSGDVNLDMVLDIPVTLSMEIGRTRIPIRNLLQLNQGSVVELERLAGEPLDVLVNGTLIAHGEVVVVNEKFGIRFTDVVSPSERIRKLK